MEDHWTMGILILFQISSIFSTFQMIIWHPHFLLIFAMLPYHLSSFNLPHLWSHHRASIFVLSPLPPSVTIPHSVFNKKLWFSPHRCCLTYRGVRAFSVLIQWQKNKDWGQEQTLFGSLHQHRKIDLQSLKMFESFQSWPMAWSNYNKPLQNGITDLKI